VLAHIIRFYGDTLQGMMGNYLEKSLQAFVDQQHLFREQMRTFIGKNPLAMMTELVEHNLSLWKSVNERLHQYVPPNPTGDAPPSSETILPDQIPATAKTERSVKDRKDKKRQTGKIKRDSEQSGAERRPARAFSGPVPSLKIPPFGET